MIALKLTDIHAHMDSNELEYFLANHDQSKLSIVSNSVSLASSQKNLELSKRFDSVIPFVGIHPEIFLSNGLSREEIDLTADRLEQLSKSARGIGEVGLDPVYGQIESQRYLFSKMLAIAEKTGKPVTIHSRNLASEILQILSTFNLKSKVLFHWFAGTENELKRIQDTGMYISFGPSIIFSKRLQNLVRLSDSRLILAETDSPTRFRSLIEASGNPTMVGSVVFQMSLLLNSSFGETCELVNLNSDSYLATQD